MATTEQLKALIRSHLERDDDRSLSVAMQVRSDITRACDAAAKEAILNDSNRIDTDALILALGERKRANSTEFREAE